MIVKVRYRKKKKKVDVFEILRWAVDFWGVEAD